jgi:hypothetical protein
MRRVSAVGDAGLLLLVPESRPSRPGRLCRGHPHLRYHGLINYKDTETKCRHLKKLTCTEGLCSRCLLESIDCRYSQSCWYFRPSVVNYCPSKLLSGSSPPPFPVSKYSIYRQCVPGVGGWGVESCWIPYSAGVKQ